MLLRNMILMLTMLCLPMSLFAQGLTYEEQMHDFGHVGIDFKVYNQYLFVNRTDVDIKILDIEVSCDCSSVHTVDSLVQPGDTVFFNLTFETKDYYGPVNKSFTVFTDHPKLPELQYFYVSIIGQWFNGIKPNPISLFFLPSKKSQVISIPNSRFDSLKLLKHLRNDKTVSVTVIKDSAKKNESIKLSVSPSNTLSTGTYKTNITLVIEADDNDETVLTIPVKIVKY